MPPENYIAPQANSMGVSRKVQTMFGLLERRQFEAEGWKVDWDQDTRTGLFYPFQISGPDHRFEFMARRTDDEPGLILRLTQVCAPCIDFYAYEGGVCAGFYMYTGGNWSADRERFQDGPTCFSLRSNPEVAVHYDGSDAETQLVRWSMVPPFGDPIPVSKIPPYFIARGDPQTERAAKLPSTIPLRKVDNFLTKSLGTVIPSLN